MAKKKKQSKRSKQPTKTKRKVKVVAKRKASPKRKAVSKAKPEVKPRDSITNAALKGRISKVKQEYLDYDYLDQLSPKELDWLNRFTEEHLNGNFEHKGTKLVKGKKKRREIWRENNSRNRCIQSSKRATGFLQLTDKPTELVERIEEKFMSSVMTNHTEDALIDSIDKSRTKKSE